MSDHTGGRAGDHEAARGASKGLFPLIRPHQLVLSPLWGQGLPVSPGVQQPLPRSPSCILPGAQPGNPSGDGQEKGELALPPSLLDSTGRNIPIHRQRRRWEQGQYLGRVVKEPLVPRLVLVRRHGRGHLVPHRGPHGVQQAIEPHLDLQQGWNPKNIPAPPQQRGMAGSGTSSSALRSNEPQASSKLGHSAISGPAGSAALPSHQGRFLWNSSYGRNQTELR